MTTAIRSPRRSRKPQPIHKPAGVLNARVQAVGPQHFGILSVDCAKARSKFMLADFYGTILIPPTVLPHDRGEFHAAIDCIRQTAAAHGLRDLVVAIERTGEYHRPVQRAFRQAGFEVRLVHPFATKQFRLPADPGNKTDDTDLAAIHRATVNGFGLLEPPLPDLFRQLQLLIRHRRDLVQKNSALACQIREHLHALMPGYAEQFEDLWTSTIALPIARATGSAAAVCQAGLAGLTQLVASAGLRCQQRTLVRIRAWSDTAPPADPHRDWQRRILADLDDDRLTKTRQIQALERDSAALLAQTPYLLLLVIPGINVVSAADLAGEMGPSAHYANANAITGRAGLFPCRYQSDQVDHANGPLVRRANRRLRAAILQIADNLIECNHYFNARAILWRATGKDARAVRVKVAKVFCRLAYAVVAGRQLLRHPCCQQRHYILDKVLAFHREHDTPMSQVLGDLDAATRQLPSDAYATEATPLAARLEKIAAGRARGPQPLATILPQVLARLGIVGVESPPSGEDDSK